MESMSVSYPSELRGCVSVTATQEEWSEILMDLRAAMGSLDLESASEQLFVNLAAWGVK